MFACVCERLFIYLFATMSHPSSTYIILCTHSHLACVICMYIIMYFITTKAPQWIKANWNSDGEKVDSRRDKSLGILCQKFLMLLLVSPEVGEFFFYHILA